MALSCSRLHSLALFLACISLLCCYLGKADEDTPQTGSGGEERDPAQIVAKALLCFNDKQIYSSCEKSYRLTTSGNLNVPPDHIEEYCKGPCLTETHLVLSCIEGIMRNFVFYNGATIRDIRDTVQAGCGHGPERGDFNVLDHIEDEESNGYKAVSRIPVTLGFLLIIVRILFV